MITNIDSISSAFIYIPGLKKSGQISGACFHEGTMKFIWISEDKKQSALVTLEEIQKLYDSFNVVPY
jgi:hypothetical protein